MAAYIVLRKALAKLEYIVHYLMADMINTRFKLIFLFHFGDIPPEGIIFWQYSMVGFSIRLISKTWRWHKLRISCYRVTSLASEPGISYQEFLPANGGFFFHITFFNKREVKYTCSILFCLSVNKISIIY